MTEKKTFKNVSSVINTFDPEHTWVVEGFRMKSNEFTHREWDMEVTFTKKPKPIQINSVVEDLMGNTGRVVAVQADKAWVNYYLDDTGRAMDFDCVEWLSELTNVS